MEQGFIKLHRSICDWEWYSDINTQAVFIYLLLHANWEDSRYRGCEIPRGSLVTGRKVISETLGISEQSVRTSLEHLKSTNEITIKSTNRFSVITITNWEKFQCLENESTSKLTNKSTNNQPTINQQLTTYKEYKNIRNKENKNNIFAPPSLEEVREYCKERNNNVDAETFISFYESKGWMVGKNKMKDWKACVRTWERSRDNKRLTDTQLYAMEHGHQSSSNPNFLDKLERESRNQSKNQYHNYIHGNYDFEQMEKELRAK